MQQLTSLQTQGNCIPDIVQGMLTHSEHAGVQEEACRALSSLTSRTYNNNVQEIGEAGGVEAVVQAMRAHKGGAGVQEQACMALRNLAGNNEDRRVHEVLRTKIAAAGGIEAVLSAMVAHKESDGVQQQACRTLRNLARDLAYQEKIGRDRGVEAILAAMKAHEGSPGVQEQACEALGILSGTCWIKHPGYHETSKDGKLKGCSRVVIAMMSLFKESGGVEERVKHAVSAHGATDATKYWGEKIIQMASALNEYNGLGRRWSSGC